MEVYLISDGQPQNEPQNGKLEGLFLLSSMPYMHMVHQGSQDTHAPLHWFL